LANGHKKPPRAWKSTEERHPLAFSTPQPIPKAFCRHGFERTKGLLMPAVENPESAVALRYASGPRVPRPNLRASCSVGFSRAAAYCCRELKPSLAKAATTASNPASPRSSSNGRVLVNRMKNCSWLPVNA